MKTLEDAIALAVIAHAGQKDKGGAPYILHPLRVMFTCKGGLHSQMASVLHDVHEDTSVVVGDDYPSAVLIALECLTRRDSEMYEEYIRRVSTNTIARRVKIADLRDNLDVTRLPTIRDKDVIRILDYLDALRVLEKREIEGD